MSKIKKSRFTSATKYFALIGVLIVSVFAVQYKQNIVGQASRVLGDQTIAAPNLIQLTSPLNYHGHYMVDTDLETRFDWTDTVPNAPVTYQIEKFFLGNDGRVNSNPEYVATNYCSPACTGAGCSTCWLDKSLLTQTVFSDKHPINTGDDLHTLWRVNAKDSLGNVYSSNWNTVFLLGEVRPIIPAWRPNILAPSDRAVFIRKPFKFAWTGALWATGSKIKIATDINFTNLLVNQVTTLSEYSDVANLPVGVKLYWHATTTDGGGELYDSPTGSFIISNPPSIPVQTAPVNNFLSSSVLPTFKWNVSTGSPSGYQFKLSLDSSFNTSVTSIDIVHPNASYVPTTALVRGKTYYWKVRSIIYNGNLMDYSDWSSTRTVKIAPAVPVLKLPANNSTGIIRKPKLTWANAVGASSYKVQVSKNADMTLPLINKTITTPYFTLTVSLPSKTKLYWRVMSVSPVGSSLWSAKWNFTTAL